MPGGDEVLDTIDMLYRASVEPELWPQALERFSLSTGCLGMAMIPITPNSTTGLIVSPSMRAVEADYRREWWRHDSRVKRIFSRQLSRGLFREDQLFDAPELARDPFRQEFCRDHGIGVFAAQLLEPLPGHVVAFSGQRAIERGFFDRDEIDRMELLGRHAARALTISLNLATGHGIATGLLEMMDRFKGGVFVLSDRGDVSLMNARAEQMLGDGLRVANRRLFVANASRQQSLDLLIASALETPCTPAMPIALPRPSGKKPLIAQAMPLTSRRALDEMGTGAFASSGALLLVVDPGLGAKVGYQCLKLLGLTSAEARLAALIGGGMRRRSAAAILGISEWTARDCLKTIYSKLNISSLADLVRLAKSIEALERTDLEDD